MTLRRYLRPSIRMEPHVAHWYAWPHLVSPVTAALNITHRHLPILESYIADPETHAAAIEDSAMTGGPFVDYGGQRVDEIVSLLEDTRRRCRPQLELARDVAALEAKVQAHGDGRPLEPLYADVPETLRGMVELVYDTHHHPGVRYLEPLLYRSAMYNESLQGLVFDRDEKDDRKFVLSTPRLDGAGAVFADVAFRSLDIDRLFSMREQSADIDQVMGMFRAPDEGNIDSLVDRFFTTQPPRRPQRHVGPEVRVRYFGHACVLLETGSTSVLVDPVVSYDYPAAPSRFTCLELAP